jgi:Protein of unknown function (DUF3302)
MILDIFALIVIGILITMVIWFVVLLGPLPGKIAAERGHAQADAIRVLGWIGVITLGGTWLIALVWAYTVPLGDARLGLEDRIAELEKQMAQVTSAGSDA